MKHNILTFLSTITLFLALILPPCSLISGPNDGIPNSFIMDDVAGMITEDTTHVEGLDDSVLAASIIQDMEYDELQAYMVELINEQRTAAGVDPVVLDEDLCSSASYRSAHMCMNEYFSHYYNNVAQPSPVHQAVCAGINYTWIGENLFRTRAKFDLTTVFTGEQLVERAVKGLVKSKSHYKIMIKSKATKVGIGIFFNEDKSHFYVTQLYSN